MRHIISPQMTRVIVRRTEDSAEVIFRIPGRCDRYDPMRSYILSDAMARALLDALREAYRDD